MGKLVALEITCRLPKNLRFPSRNVSPSGKYSAFRMNQSSIRTICQWFVGVFVAAAILHTWLVMGLVVPVTVAGSSMAPTLEGPRRMFRCDACQFEFPVGTRSTDRRRSGHLPALRPKLRHVASDQFDLRGDRLLVDRTAFVLRPPRRWEVVVFRSPRTPINCS